MMNSRWSPRSSGRRRRALSARAMDSGWAALCLRIRAKSDSVSETARDAARLRRDTFESFQDVLDLGGRRHRGRALQPCRDDGTSDIGKSDRSLERPTLEQPVAERAPETVTGTESVNHLDRIRLNLNAVVSRFRENTAWAHFHDRELDAALQQGIRCTMRIAFADRDFALLAIADRDRDLSECTLHLEGRELWRIPEHRAVVEVQDGEWPTFARRPGSEVGGSAWLLRKTGDGRPIDARSTDRVKVQLAHIDHEVRRDRRAVKVEREVVWCKDLAERDRRIQPVHGPHESIIDAQATQFPANESAEGIIAGAGYHGGASAMLRGGDRDVRRTAPDVFTERGDVFEPDTALQRIEVHPDATDRYDLEWYDGCLAHDAQYRFLSRSMYCTPYTKEAPLLGHIHIRIGLRDSLSSVSYTHLRAHETDSYLVCRLLLEK